jgi:hypothetical protein
MDPHREELLRVGSSFIFRASLPKAPGLLNHAEKIFCYLSGGPGAM